MNNKAKLYGWFVVAASWLAVFSLFGYRATFAILKEPMSLDLGWSQTQITFGYSLMMIFYALTAFFGGMILDRWGTRPVYALSAIFGGAGFLCTSFVESYLAYLFTFGVLAGIATGMLWVTSTVSVRKWFVGKSYATMWGIAFAGAPVAQWVLAEVTKNSLSSGAADAWRNTMLLLGIIIFITLLAATLIARKTPEKYNLIPFGELNSNNGTEPEWSVKQAFASYAIWGAILTFLTSMMAEFLIWTQIVSYWTTDLGWTQERAVDVYKTIGIIGIFSMPLLGIAADKLVAKTGSEARGRKIMLIAGPLTGAIACILLLQSDSLLLAYIAAFIFAVYWAIVPGGVVGYTGAVYGRKTLGKIWGLATLIVMGIGPFTGSFLGGLFKDLSGTYIWSISFALVSFITSALFAFTLPLRAEK
ncbi:MAG: nitrate/nitrite transporter [Rhodothermaceae bacterium]